MNILVILIVALSVIAIFWGIDQLNEFMEKRELLKETKEIYERVIDDLRQIIKDNDTYNGELYGPRVLSSLLELFDSVSNTYESIKTYDIKALRLTHTYAVDKLWPKTKDLIKWHIHDLEVYLEKIKNEDNEDN